MNQTHGTRYGPEWPPRLIWGRMGNRVTLYHAYQAPDNTAFNMHRWAAGAADANNWDYARLMTTDDAQRPRFPAISPLCRRTQPHAYNIYPIPERNRAHDIGRCTACMRRTPVR